MQTSNTHFYVKSAFPLSASNFSPPQPHQHIFLVSTCFFQFPVSQVRYSPSCPWYVTYITSSFIRCCAAISKHHSFLSSSRPTFWFTTDLMVLLIELLNNGSFFLPNILSLTSRRQHSAIMFGDRSLAVSSLMRLFRYV